MKLTYNSETSRYDGERRGIRFSISAETREEMIQSYISNNTGEYNAEEIRPEAEEYVDNPHGWTDEEFANVEQFSRWAHDNK